MFLKPFTLLCVFTALAACARIGEPPFKAAAAPVNRVADDKKSVKVLPEHFDRVRDEQLEREEDELRQRDHHN
jgi:hypothetical protein